MIKRAAAVAMSALTIGTALASPSPCTWQFVEKSDDGRLQLHFSSCSVRAEGKNTSVWVRYKYGWNYRFKHERVLFQKQHWLFDCKDHRVAVIRQVFYNLRNKPYVAISHKPPQFTEEDFIVDSIGQKVCPMPAQ